MSQYCIYLRKSRADMDAEAHGEGETLARHERLLLEVAKRGGYNITMIYREIVSGDTIAARPVMQQLLQEVETGMWSGVLVVEVERLARGDTVDQGIIAQTFRYSGTKIITPTKVYDPENEFDEEYFEFGLFMSRREYKAINRRLQRGRIASVKEGKYINAIPPYGYRKIRIPGDKGFTLVPDEAEADVVRLIFRLYTDGEIQADGTVKQLGSVAIAYRLDKMGITPPKSGAAWCSKSISQMLNNPVYVGKIRWNRTKQKKRVVNGVISMETVKCSPEDVILVNGLHPALISEETFAKAQELLARHGPSPVPSRNTVVNPLAGILVCGKCGRAIIRSSYQPFALRCINRKCDNISSYYSVVEEKLLEALDQWLSDYRLVYSGSGNEADNALLDLKRKTIRKKQNEIRTLNQQLANTHDFLEQGVYDTDTFLSRSRILTERIESAEKNLKELSAELTEDEKRAASRKYFVPKVEKLIEVYHELPNAKAKNDMLKEVFEKVVYTKTKRCRKGDPLDDFELVLYPKIPVKL